jgi:predicted nucleic acid-binding protein
VRTILDTGPLVALLNRNDQHHAWSVQAFERLTLPLWACEPVLTEASYLTGRPREILAMVRDGEIRIGLAVEELAVAIAKLLARYPERMDLVDACVVRMSEMARDSRVFTTDHGDFSVYRRNGRDVIPLIAPER